MSPQILQRELSSIRSSQFEFGSRATGSQPFQLGNTLSHLFSLLRLFHPIRETIVKCGDLLQRHHPQHIHFNKKRSYITITVRFQKGLHLIPLLFRDSFYFLGNRIPFLPSISPLQRNSQPSQRKITDIIITPKLNHRLRCSLIPCFILQHVRPGRILVGILGLLNRQPQGFPVQKDRPEPILRTHQHRTFFLVDFPA